MFNEAPSTFDTATSRKIASASLLPLRNTRRRRSGTAHATRARKKDLMILGNFYVDRRDANPMFDAFVSKGRTVPEGVRNVKIT